MGCIRCSLDMGIDAVHDDPNWSIRAATAVLRMKNTYPQGLRTTADDMSHFFHDQFTVQAPKTMNHGNGFSLENHGF